MTDIEASRRALVVGVLEGEGKADVGTRRAAFDNVAVAAPLQALVEKVGSRPGDVTEEDFAAARASGMSEDQIFEVTVCAAVGQASRQHEVALAALRAATKGD